MDANAGYIGELLTNNVFAYTDNNPINREDPNGTNFIADADGGGFGAELGEAVLQELLENELDTDAEIDAIKEATAEKEGMREEKIIAAEDFVENKSESKTIKWSSRTVSNAARQLENGETSVTVNTRAEAEELFLGEFQGKGYTNVTGKDAMDTKNLLGTKGNTYHWDDIIGDDGRVVGHSPTNPDGEMPHLQIQPAKGKIIRIFFEK